MKLTCLFAKKTNNNRSGGFALPTVLIASIIMLTVLLVSVASTVTTRMSIAAQTYDQMAQNAGDAGLAYAKACLEANNGIPLWSDANPLTPSTDCTGTQLSGFTCPTGSLDVRCSVTVNGGANVQVLVVGGGGGGAPYGGGGAGGLIFYSSYPVKVGQPYTVTVGGGGNGVWGGPGANGTNSVFGELIAIGGGGGGSDSGGINDTIGKNGGSGGGGAGRGLPVSFAGGSGTISQGFAGGFGSATPFVGGGGGGASIIGANGGTTGGTGGAGLQFNISGVPTFYAGGGGGGTYSSGAGGAGGIGGGGTGASYTVTAGTGGTANSGGGGGGGAYSGTYANGYNGGSGIVIVSYPTGSITATSSVAPTTSGGNTIHKFITSGTFTVSASTFSNSPVVSTYSVGLPTIVNGKANEVKSVGSTKLLKSSTGSAWRTYSQTSRLTIPATAVVKVLVVGGGGAGGGNGSGQNVGGGGGGGGGVVYNADVSVTSRSYSVVVGNGGTGSTSAPTSGAISSFDTISASGGGYGFGYNTSTSGWYAGASGSSGGGGGYSLNTGGSGLNLQGKNGGNGSSSANYPGGGGGGAGTVGANVPNSNAGGNGGQGIVNSISGTAVLYGGGGGGGLGNSGNSGKFGIGGSGGGGNGSASTNGVSGTANTGGGGGGAGNNTAVAPYANTSGGNGGSGVVIVSYTTGSIAATGGTVTKVGGNTIHTFTSGTSAFKVGAGLRSSCHTILDAGESTGSGLYWVYPSGSSGILVYCDMTNDGGGWTLVLQNNSTVSTPSPNWTNSINNININGTFGSDLSLFDILIGLSYWNNLGTQLRAQVGSSPSVISHKATYDFSLNSSNYYAINLSNQSIISGATAPGLYSSHNGRPFTTHDADHDSYGTNCSAMYNNHPWWYGACWDGNFFAGGGYQEAAYWTGSTTDYYAYGSIWVK